MVFPKKNEWILKIADKETGQLFVNAK